MEIQKTEKSPTQLFNEAIALSNEIKFDEAAGRLRYLLKDFPHFSEAADALAVVLSNLSITHGRNGDDTQTAACLIESLCLNPGQEEARTMLADTLNNKAVRDLEQRHAHDVLVALARSIRIKRGSSPEQQQMLLEAFCIDSQTSTPGMSWAEKVDQLERILERTPEHRVAKLFLVTIMPQYCKAVLNTPALEDSFPALRRSTEHAEWLLDHPGETEITLLIVGINVLAGTLCQYDTSDRALDLEEKLLALAPERMDLHQNKMFTYLYRGDLDRAWCEEHWEDLNRASPAPMWDGRSRGDVIHLVNTNGLGDFLQSVRHVPALSAYFDEIHIWDPAFAPRKHRSQMAALMARSAGFEKVTLHPGSPRITMADTYCELFALPFALHATRADYSGPKAYLSADPELVAGWSSLVRKPGRLSVALAWSSGNDSASGLRNIGLDNLSTLFECHDLIDFYSIQNTTAKFDLLKVDRPPTMTDLGIVDLDHMVALMNAVDLVIVPDGGLSHIAGSTGANLWVGAHKYCDWRWGRAETPLGLYGSARIFRQPTPGDWRSVCDAMREALIALANGIAPQPSAS